MELQDLQEVLDFKELLATLGKKDQLAVLEPQVLMDARATMVRE